MNKLYVLYLLILLNPIVVLPSHSDFDMDQVEEVIIYGMPYEFEEFSVYTAVSDHSKQWMNAVYEGLYHRSSANNRGWVPGIAADYPEISPNNLVLTITIQSGLLFSNGDPITSEDVEFSLLVALTPDINRAFYSKYLGYLDNISLTIISDYSFTITLNQPHAFLYDLISFPIIPKAYYHEKYSNCVFGITADCVWNSENGFDAVASGPMILTDISDDHQNLILEVNPYWRDVEKIKMDGIIFQAIKNRYAAISALADGSIHIFDSNYIPGLNELDNIDGITEAFVGAPLTQELAINHKHPWFGTGKAINQMNGEIGDNYTAASILRKAISYTLDRNYFVTELMDGLAQAAATQMPSASLGWTPSILPDPYDLDLARTTMESLGFDYSVLGDYDPITQSYETNFFSVNILIPDDNLPRVEWASEFSVQLPRIGIGVTQNETISWNEAIRRTVGNPRTPELYDNGGYDLLFYGHTWGLEFNPKGMFDSSGNCDTGSCRNFYNFDLTESISPIASVVSEYISELDFDRRLQIAEELQNLLAEWLPSIPILYPQSHWAWSADVTGIDSLMIETLQQEWDKVYRVSYGGYEPPTTQDGSEESVSNPLMNPFVIVLIVIAVPIIGIALFQKFSRKYVKNPSNKQPIQESHMIDQTSVKILCRSCEIDNPSGSNFCMECGSSLR